MEIEENSNFVKCFICSEDIKDARILPCLHSFCFECLKNKFNEQISNKKSNLKCPKCNVYFERPEGGLENLKKNEFLECLNKTNKIFCGTCLKEEAVNFCLDCKLYLCSSCTFVHQRVPALKNHVLAKINSSRKEDIEATYCKSCKKWVDCETTFNHKSCKLKFLSEFKKEFSENLEQEIMKKSNDIDALKANLSSIEVQRLSLTNETDKLINQIQKQCEDIKNQFNKYIDSCKDQLHVRINRKMAELKEQLDLHSSELLKLNTELKEKIKNYKNMILHFDPVKFVEAIENDNLKVLDDDENILRKNQNLISNSLNENLNLYFEPKLLDETFFSSQISIGDLKSTHEIEPKLIKTIEVSDLFGKISINKTKLYVGGHSNYIYDIDVYCNNEYEYLSSFELQISNLTYYNNELVDNFLCVLNDSSLEIYDLEKEKKNPDLKKTIKFEFTGKGIFRSSGTNLFILEEKKIFEITLDGEIIRVISLPECIDTLFIRGVVCLKEDYFAISNKFKLYLINCNGDVIKQIDTDSIQALSSIHGSTADNNFNLFVADFHEQKIYVFDFDLNFMKSFDAQCSPEYLCFDSTANRLLVIGCSINDENYSLNVFKL